MLLLLFGAPTIETNLVGAFGLGETGGYRRNSVSGHTGILESFGQWTNTAAADKVLSSSTSTPTGRAYAVFNSTDQSYLQRPNDSWISLDGAPFSGVVHVRMDSLSQDQFIATQTIFSGSNRGWQIYYSNSSNRFVFGMSTTGANMNTVTANTFGAPSTATWYTLAFGWDGTNIWVSVNGGTRDTSAVGSAMFNTTAQIRIGYRDSLPLDAGVAALYLWTRSISDANIAYIHNGGTFQPPITIVTPSTYWEGGFEPGDLTELTLDSGGSEQNSGTYTSTDSTAQAHAGTHSRKATITTPNTPESGVRYFRNREIEVYSDTEVSAWFYIPSLITVSSPNYWNNIFQFKSDPGTGSEPMWYLSIANRGGGAMYLRLYDWQTSTWYEQGSTNLPVATWFKISARYKNGVTDGFVTFAQDDKIIFHKTNVKTIFSGKTAIWSVNNYSEGQTPSPTDIYIDDMSVYSPVLVGPEVGYRDLFRGALGGVASTGATVNAGPGLVVAFALAASLSSTSAISAGPGFAGATPSAAATTSTTTVSAGPAFANAFGIGASISNTTAPVTAGPGFASAFGTAASLADTSTISAAPGAAFAFGIAASLASTSVVDAGPGAAFAYGLAAAVSTSTVTNIDAGPGAAQAFGVAAAASDTTSINAGPGAAYGYGIAASLATTTAISAAPGSAVAYGVAAALADTTAINAGPASAQAFGVAATLAPTTVNSAGPSLAQAFGIAADVTTASITNIDAGTGYAAAYGLAASLASTSTVSAGPATAQAFGVAAAVSVVSNASISAGPGFAGAFGLPALQSSTTQATPGTGYGQAFGLAASLASTTQIDAAPGVVVAFGLAGLSELPITVDQTYSRTLGMRPEPMLIMDGLADGIDFYMRRGQDFIDEDTTW